MTWAADASSATNTDAIEYVLERLHTVWFFAPNTQYSGLTYADRNGILVYDAGLRFGRSLGNDESFFYLM